MARWFRELFDEQCAYGGESLYDDILAPWIDDTRASLEEAKALLDVEGDIKKDAHLEELSWNLYALSRVLDYAVWNLQPKAPEGERPETSPRDTCGLTSAELSDFAESVGLTVVGRDAFHPFYNEPVFVEPSDDSADRPELVDSVWPCLMLGNMLIYRGGVRIRSNSAELAKERAEKAPLFWSRYRRARLSMDLSLGWGSNSQWRTDFRRDFECGESFLYNADGFFSLNEPRHKRDQFRADLPDDEWVHLLKYRYALAGNHNPHDLWPWNYRYVEQR